MNMEKNQKKFKEVDYVYNNANYKTKSWLI